MLDELTNNLAVILRDEDLQKYAGDAFGNFVKAVAFLDMGASVDGIKDVKDFVFYIPNALFWDKMQRYLFGTFKCYEEQVKLSSKFTKDNPNYIKFVKRQIHLIDKMDADEKIDYFANLTRYFLLHDMSIALYYKLANFISICTPEELSYIKDCNCDQKFSLNTMISSLYCYGLFEQVEREQGGADYVLSGFAKALKSSSLNFDEGLYTGKCFLTYDDVEPFSIAEPMPLETLNNLFDNPDGGGH